MPQTAPASGKYGAPTILYAEAKPTFARPVADALRREGWNVYYFSEPSGADAMMNGDYRVDLMLFDNEMPYVSGLELARHARKLEHRRRTPIILYSLGDCTEEARRAGVTKLLRKSANIQLLVDAVRRLLGGGKTAADSKR